MHISVLDCDHKNSSSLFTSHLNKFKLILHEHYFFSGLEIAFPAYICEGHFKNVDALEGCATLGIQNIIKAQLVTTKIIYEDVFFDHI